MEFEWDESKRLINIEKHGIDFKRVKIIFEYLHHEEHLSYPNEPRWMAVGQLQGLIYVIIFTKRDGVIRIISARRAKKYEERKYQALY